jgi:hypothetical protein
LTVQAKILVGDTASGSDFGIEGEPDDDQHDYGTTNAHVDRRRGERDDDGADGWNQRVGHHMNAAEKDLQLLETSVEQDERGKDLVGGLGTNVLDGEARDGLKDAHCGGGSTVVL